MDKKIGVALIGCGVIAPSHLKALSTIEDVRVRALCDIMPERAKRFAGSFGADVLTDYREVAARDDIDVIHICTPHHTHADIALSALHAGKYVLCEKPMAITFSDAQKIIGCADGRIGFVYQNRYNGPVVRVKRMIDSGELGPIRTLRASVCWQRDADYYAADAWRGAWTTEGGGSLINQAIHTVDLLNYLAGPVISVKGSYTTDLLRGVVEVDENTHAVLRFQSGIVGLLHTSNSYGVSEPPEIRIVFERGALRIAGDMLLISGEDGVEKLLYREKEMDAGSEKKKVTESESESESASGYAGKAVYGNGHMGLIRDFYRCVREKTPFWIDAKEAYHSLWTVLSIYESSRRDDWVSREV